MGVGPVVRVIRPPYGLDVRHSRRQRQTLAWLLGAGLGVGALVTVFVSSGGIEDVLDALERVTLGWTLAAVVAMLVGYLLLALQMRRLAQGQGFVGSRRAHGPIAVRPRERASRRTGARSDPRRR